VGLEYATTTNDVQREFDYASRTLDRVILGCDQLGWPEAAMIDAGRPVLGRPVNVWSNGLQLEQHFGDGVLHHWIVGHRLAAHRDRLSGLGVFDCKIEGALSQP